jgi:uncharacterized protein
MNSAAQPSKPTNSGSNGRGESGAIRHTAPSTDKLEVADSGSKFCDLADSKPAAPELSDRERPHSSLELHPVTGLQRVFYLVAAGFFFVLALLGAILPGLPTTPFLLLTSYFLVRTSPQLNSALLRSRFFGPILRDWQRHRGVRPHVKVQSIVLVVITLAITLYFSGLTLALKGVVVALGLVGILVILRLPETP